MDENEADKLTPGSGLLRVPAEVLRRHAEQLLLRAGVAKESALLTAEGLWQASLRGVDSHGVRLLPHYVKGVLGGRINPRPDFDFQQTSPSTGRLDADHGFGHAAGIHAMRHAVRLANEAGTAHVSVRNSSHCGALAYFAFEACKADMIGTAYTHATPKVRTPNSITRFVGTNPLCLAAPMAEEDPFCYDGSMTHMTANKVRVYGERNLPLPPGVGANERGEETCNPAKVTQLLPIGDYKGFGMAIMVDLLCGLLSGMPVGDEISDMFGEPFSNRRLLGQFFGAFRIDVFEDPERFKCRLQEMAHRIRALPRREEQVPVQVPGDPEKACRTDRTANGIPLAPTELAQLHALARELGVPPLDCA
jgi:ureidoglycolate dehydrogenase (NAD+)